MTSGKFESVEREFHVLDDVRLPMEDGVDDYDWYRIARITGNEAFIIAKSQAQAESQNVREIIGKNVSLDELRKYNS